MKPFGRTSQFSQTKKGTAQHQPPLSEECHLWKSCTRRVRVNLSIHKKYRQQRKQVKWHHSDSISRTKNGTSYIHMTSCFNRASLVAQMVKHLPAMWETRVQSLGWEDPLEKEMATHSSTLAWKIPWTEEPGRLHSMGSQRVGHDWVFNNNNNSSSKNFSEKRQGRKTCKLKETWGIF